jgi:hypothetical protein
MPDRCHVQPWLRDEHHGMMEAAHDGLPYTARNTSEQPRWLFEGTKFYSLQGLLQSIEESVSEQREPVVVVFGSIRDLE